ncbi:hypothetical protein L798_06557 [Zootermopsis nevadensis]|uniref:Uncharacterized protein n=1 Tax=Zootermopsis nevadensis TaxID=136037 RepID=A0A067R804_ZOONE|nr:hypothetical protein L798_06557 [Zootermopsis nevadensis]
MLDRLANALKPDAENTWDILLGQPDNSTTAEHRSDTGHSINFKRIFNLDKATRYVGHVIKEAIEIRLHPKNFNGDGCFTLSVLVPSGQHTQTIQRHQSGRKAKLSQHLPTPTRPNWLIHSFEHRHWLSIYVALSGWTLTSNLDTDSADPLNIDF